MITPDDLVARFAPPLTGGDLYARQAAFIDDAYQLAERAMDALPRGHHLDQAVTALETAAHWVCAGLAAVATDAAIEAEQSADQIPYVLAPAAADAAPPRSLLGEGLALDVGMWRMGIRTASLHPLARLVALTLGEAADDHGFIRDREQPTVEDLCLGTGLPTPEVLAALEELCGQGWISRYSDGSTTRYQLRLPVPNSR
jgi:hypothetical protein